MIQCWLTCVPVCGRLAGGKSHLAAFRSHRLHQFLWGKVLLLCQHMPEFPAQRYLPTGQESALHRLFQV